MQQVPICSWKGLAVVATGKEKISSRKQYFGGDLGRLGLLPMDQTGHTQACCQKVTGIRNPMESPAVGQ